MAKRTLVFAPKLLDAPTPPAALPVQEFSPAQLEAIAQQPKSLEFGETASKPATKPRSPKKEKSAPRKAKSARATRPDSYRDDPDKRPQGRPPRLEPVKRISSDLPAELYDQVQAELRTHGYTLNGFLAKVIRGYFEQQGRVG